MNECNCKFCQTSRKHRAFLEQMPEDMRKFYDKLYEVFFEIQEEYDCKELYWDNLKRVYPEIYKEVRKIEKLERKDAKFVQYLI